MNNLQETLLFPVRDAEFTEAVFDRMRGHAGSIYHSHPSHAGFDGLQRKDHAAGD